MITEDQCKLRNLAFHSWRHFNNFSLRGRIPDVKLQRLTGHQTQEMAERNSRFRVDEFRDAVLAIQEEMRI